VQVSRLNRPEKPQPILRGGHLTARVPVLGTGLNSETGLNIVTHSIIIPAYNEASRLGPTLEAVLAYLRSQPWIAEVIVVDDGSTDETAKAVEEVALGNPNVRLVRNEINRGKGYSVRHGMQSARGDVVAFSDADLSSPVEELPKLLDALHDGADIAIGSRWLQASVQTQRQSFSRQLVGRIYNFSLRVILGLRFKDTQCGFKAFSRRAVHAIVQKQTIERWGFDPEILFIGRKFGYRIDEIPVRWGHKEGSSIHPAVDGLRMFQELVRIRWNDICGCYERRRKPRARQIVTRAEQIPR
jgi:dolichyl-phosphate beta-glucosyltransferase